MALIRDYEIEGTGVVVPNAYHVVTNVKVTKRMQDVPAPPDVSRPDGLTAGSHREEDAVHWKAGYVGEIAISVWKDRAARENGSNPIGTIGTSPTEVMVEATVGPHKQEHRCRFFVDVNNGVDYTTQAYTYLKTLDYYRDATED